MRHRPGRAAVAGLNSAGMEIAIGALTAAMADGGHEPRVTIHHLRENYCGMQAEARYSAAGSDQVERVLGPAAANDCARGNCAEPQDAGKR